MSLLKTLAGATAALALLASSAMAHEFKLGDLVINHPWTRATPPNAPAAGGFLKVHNGGAADDKLISASSPAAARVELHEMAVVDSIMKMREVEGGIALPAGQDTELKPGGLHIMLMDLKQPFTEGESIPMTLTFEKAGKVDVTLKVEKMGAKGNDHGSHNGAAHSH